MYCNVYKCIIMSALLIASCGAHRNACSDGDIISCAESGEEVEPHEPTFSRFLKFVPFETPVRFMGMSKGARQSYEWAMKEIERRAGCQIFSEVSRWDTEYNGRHINLECGDENGRGRSFWRAKGGYIVWARATIDCCIEAHRNKIALHELMHTLGFVYNTQDTDKCDIMSAAVWNCGKITDEEARILYINYCALVQ